MLKLFYAVGSCPRVVHHARGSGRRIRNGAAGLRPGDQRKPEYLKVNPKGRVPALITDSGILTETPAILAYIAQVFPASKLAPLSDPFAFARVQGLQQLSLLHRAREPRAP